MVTADSTLLPVELGGPKCRAAADQYEDETVIYVDLLEAIED